MRTVGRGYRQPRLDLAPLAHLLRHTSDLAHLPLGLCQRCRLSDAGCPSPLGSGGLAFVASQVLVLEGAQGSVPSCCHLHSSTVSSGDTVSSTSGRTGSSFLGEDCRPYCSSPTMSADLSRETWLLSLFVWAASVVLPVFLPG